MQVATGEKSAENNSEIVEATTQMEALNVTETLQVETSEAAQNPIAQNNVAELCAFKIEKPRMPKFNGGENTQYSNRILNT